MEILRGLNLINFFVLRDRLRTSINVLGDAYGCGIVEHLSRNELRKLDEEAEHEFAQIIATNTDIVPLGMQTHPNQAIQEESIALLNNPNSRKLSVSLCDERKVSTQILPASNSACNQFNEFKSFERRPSDRSQSSFHQQFQQNQQLQQQIQQQQQQLDLLLSQSHAQNQLQPQPPSIVVMDAVRRRSRALLFSSKLPAGVNSMPQISQYSSNTNSNLKSNLDNSNEDSNV